MGIPSHYAVEMPVRAYTLLCQYWDQVVASKNEDFGGPLATTFLVAMAGPMFNFPYERIRKPKLAKDERHLSQKLTDEIDRVLGPDPFAAAPFFVKGMWRYTYVPGDEAMSVVTVPEHVLNKLRGDDAQGAASDVETFTWFSTLRQALAHSTIAYLDGAGRQEAGSPTEMIAFVSEDQKKGTILGHHVFRISRDDFRIFVPEWIAWLTA